MNDKDKLNKYSTLFRSIRMHPHHTTSKFYLPIIGFSAIVIFYYYYFIATPTLWSDRSDLYSVKVIPSNLDDRALTILDPQQFSYLAVIDAGSSGCRAHIYRYGKLGSIDGKIYILPQHKSKKLKPGLSSFVNNPTDAGASLVNLIAFIKEQVPENYWKNTPIWLKATAGLRLLEKPVSDKILESVRLFLKTPLNSPFLFRPAYATLISGNEEGAFGWIAFNYLKKIIGPKRSGNVLPYAVVEMGGASSQVSQVAPSVEEANKIPGEYRYSFEIENEVFHLYTYSYLGYGAEQGREAYNKLITGSNNGGGTSTSSAIGDGSGNNGSTEQKPQQQSIKDACLNQGYSRDGKVTPRQEAYEGAHGPVTVTGSSSSNACLKELSQLFSLDNGGGAGKTGKTISCKGSSGSDNTRPLPHSFNCIYQPDFVVSSPNFLVFENFYYVSSAVGVQPAAVSSSPDDTKNADSAAVVPLSVVNPGNDSKTSSSNLSNKPISVVYPLVTTPQAIKNAASKVCALTWNQVQQSYPLDDQPKDNNIKWCFSASYAADFLIYGLKLPADKRVTIQKYVHDSEIEWALGAAYKEASDFLKKTYLRSSQ